MRARSSTSGSNGLSRARARTRRGSRASRCRYAGCVQPSTSHRAAAPRLEQRARPPAGPGRRASGSSRAGVERADAVRPGGAAHELDGAPRRRSASASPAPRPGAPARAGRRPARRRSCGRPPRSGRRRRGTPAPAWCATSSSPSASRGARQPVVEVARGAAAALAQLGEQRRDELVAVRDAHPLVPLVAVLPHPELHVRPQVDRHERGHVRPVLDQAARPALRGAAAAARCRRGPSGCRAACSARAASTLTESIWSTPVRSRVAAERAHRRARRAPGRGSPGRPGRCAAPGHG